MRMRHNDYHTQSRLSVIPPDRQKPSGRRLRGLSACHPRWVSLMLSRETMKGVRGISLLSLSDFSERVRIPQARKLTEVN